MCKYIQTNKKLSIYLCVNIYKQTKNYLSIYLKPMINCCVKMLYNLNPKNVQIAFVSMFI